MHTIRYLYTLVLCFSIAISTVLLMSLPSRAWACVGPDQASVVAAVAAAGAGDTVEVCAGSATWTLSDQSCGGRNRALCITKGITLKGAGIDVTNITYAGTSLYYGVIAYVPITPAYDEPFEMYGFTLNGNDAYLPGGLLGVYNTSTTYVLTKIKIHHNKIKNVAGSGSTGLYIGGMVYGVAYLNQFDRVNDPFRPMGRDEYSWKTLSREYGSSENFYFEDNNIYFSSPATSATGGTESGQGGKQVIRYNTWDVTNAKQDELWDVHGLQPAKSTEGGMCGYSGYPPCDPTVKSAQQYSTIVAEFYGNMVFGYSTARRWMHHRGGRLMMFNNGYTSASGNPWIHYGQFACNSAAAYGYGDGQHVNDTHVWNNIANGSRIAITKNVDYCASAIGSPYTITADRDYFNDNVYTFNGTSGVGCGTLANRPTTCTKGVGYWATNQSCSNLAGMVGAYPQTPISGTLYKCTETNTWTAYYTPYTYPHPYRLQTASYTPPPTTTEPTTTTAPTTTTTTTTTAPTTTTVTEPTTTTTAPTTTTTTTTTTTPPGQTKPKKVFNR